MRYEHVIPQQGNGLFHMCFRSHVLSLLQCLYWVLALLFLLPSGQQNPSPFLFHSMPLFHFISLTHSFFHSILIYFIWNATLQNYQLSRDADLHFLYMYYHFNFVFKPSLYWPHDWHVIFSWKQCAQSVFESVLSRHVMPSLISVSYLKWHPSVKVLQWQ